MLPASPQKMLPVQAPQFLLQLILLTPSIRGANLLPTRGPSRPCVFFYICSEYGWERLAVFPAPVGYNQNLGFQEPMKSGRIISER